MKYITSAGDEGRQEGRTEAWREVVEAEIIAKFGDDGSAFADKLRDVKDLATLAAIRLGIHGGKNLDDLQDLLQT